MGHGAGTLIRSTSTRALCVVATAACLIALGSCSSDSTSRAATAKGSGKVATTTTTAPTTGDGSAVPAAAGTAAGTDAAAERAAAAPHGNVNTPAAKAKDPGTLAPVALDRPVDFGNGVTVRLSSIQPVEAEAKIPGETSGPAVRITVSITNGSDAPVDLGNVSVVLTGAGGTPTATVTNPDIPPLSGSVAPGASASGTYTFTIPAANRDDTVLTVKYAAAVPTAAFTGSLPNG